LIAKGFTQTEGLDYFKTLSPIVKPTTVCILIALATTTAIDWIIHQLDVDNAFLYKDLHEEICIKPPPDFLFLGQILFVSLNSLYMV